VHLAALHPALKKLQQFFQRQRPERSEADVVPRGLTLVRNVLFSVFLWPPILCTTEPLR
jgi:hypothetical protein